LLKKITLPFFALLILLSSAYGVVIESEITPKFIAEHKGEFEVKTKSHGDYMEFIITRVIHEPKHLIGDIIIRKDDHSVVECTLHASKDKTSVRFIFKLSPDYVSGSEFILSENSLGKLGNQEIPLPGGDVYRFQLHKFINNADAPK
jgi:hypothetical protein